MTNVGLFGCRRRVLWCNCMHIWGNDMQLGNWSIRAYQKWLFRSSDLLYYVWNKWIILISHIHFILFVTLHGVWWMCFPLDSGDLSFGATFLVHTHVGARTCLQIVMQVYCAHHPFDEHKNHLFSFGFGSLICRSCVAREIRPGGSKSKHHDSVIALV